MKKVLLFSLLFFTCINYCNASTSTANSYILMDMDTGRVIESKNKDTSMLIASITKIMTCILAIENGNLEEIVKVDDSILKSYGSGIYISVGEEIKLIDLLYGLMLRSGNDAAIMISSYISGSEEEFVKLMNQKAKEIGMKNTIFYNSSGLDNTTRGNLSTSYDMALLTKYAMQNDTYKEIVKTKKHTIKTNLKTYIWHNKNKLLSYEYVTGGKTGYTEKAKRTLVSTASKNNINLIVVTIKDSDDWNTHKTLYEKIFDNYINFKVINKNTFKVEKDSYYDDLYVKDDVYITMNKEETHNLISHIKLEKKENYQDGDIVGTNYIYLDDTLVKEIPVYAKKKKKKTETIFDLIRKWLT
ncbi:MAG: D-alanyl-D-alanine carboxypeptidase [Bacilli bacterium]|nr:D-alanyl-D-alanine carboxypeptidase [Bacilli bacterium]